MKKLEAAQHRANISAYLSNHPGEHTTEAIATSIQLNARTTGQMLGAMARGWLIADNGKAGKGRRWYWPAQPTSEAEKMVSAATGEPPAPTPRKVSTNEEVELVVNGRTIIIGNNPSTGRLRITLE